MVKSGSVLVHLGVTLLLILLSSPFALSHKQPVHQYIVLEGYSLLVKTYGNDIPQLSRFIGPADQSAIGDSAWQQGFVTTGAWREDEEDVIYHYDILPGLNYALTSITHFWSADRGDDVDNMFRLQIEQPPLPPIKTDIGPFPNAHAKLRKFAEGGWVLNYPRLFVCRNTANNHWLVITPLVSEAGFGVPLSYSGLTEFYTRARLTVRSDQPNVCTVLDVTEVKTIQLSDLTEIEVADDVRNIVAWEVLGRMCHVLADMSVPAHAHLDEHGLLADSYEDYVGGAGDPYKAWNAGIVDPAIIIDGPTHEVLHALIYTMQQQADHFGSNGPANGDGNDVIGGDATTAEQETLNAINLSSLGGPTTDAGPWSVADLNIIRDKTLPYAIRATAGLLYWFCVSTGLMSPIVSVAPAPDENLAMGVHLEQNYPNPFNPATTVGYTVPERSHVTLTIFNTLGEKVADLVNGEVEAGYHDVRFDARNLASGVYLYRLRVRPLDFPPSGIPPNAGFGKSGTAIGRDSKSGAGDFVQTRKCVLLW